MSFRMKYDITSKYITSNTKRRSGQKMSKVGFIVAHDTGNPKSTALNNVTHYQNSRNDMQASAHIFVDDKYIYECVPALTGTPEKAWHVIYNVTTDNKMYGDDANDIAIGVEYCYGSNINANEAYKRYIWVMAYICYKFGLEPSKAIVGHHILDPNRKSDPVSGLRASGRTYEQMLKDVVSEYEECTKEEDEPMTKEEKQAFNELVETVRAIENKHEMNVPAWASVAVSAAVEAKLIDTPNGGSYDFYRLITVMWRKGII